MRRLLARMGWFAALLAVSGAALAVVDNVSDGATVPEPGVLELVAIAAVVGWIIQRKRGGK